MAPACSSSIPRAIGDACVDTRGGSPWSPDVDEQPFEAKDILALESLAADLQRRLENTQSELDETKGALTGAERRASELSQALEAKNSDPVAEDQAEAGSSVDVRLETLKSTLAVLLVVASFAVVVTLLLISRADEPEEICEANPEKLLRSCDICGSGTMIMPLGGNYEKRWPAQWRALLYFCILIWSFQGVNVICDEFMAAIEQITSSTRTVWETNDKGDKVAVKRTIWNETLANLSLMALGSSAPEILLSSVELCSDGFFAGSLGPQTVVGSAAFNLFCISSVCVSAIPGGEVRRIEKIQVFVFTCLCSVFAYFWMWLVVVVISPNKVEIWEGVVTLILFFAFLTISFLADKRYSTASPETPQETIADSSQASADTHRQLVDLHHSLEDRFSQPVSLEGVKSMMERLSALKITEASEEEGSPAYGFLKRTVVSERGAGILPLRVGSLRGAHRLPVKMSYRTLNGMAEAGKRYESATGTLNFKPGEETQDISIAVHDVTGPPQEFYVELYDIKTEGAESDKAAARLDSEPVCVIWSVKNAVTTQTLELPPSKVSISSASTGSLVAMLPDTELVSSTSTASTSQKQATVSSRTSKDQMAELAGDQGEIALEIPGDNIDRRLYPVRSGSSLDDEEPEAAEGGNPSTASPGQGSGEESFRWSHWSDKAIEAFYCNGSPEEQESATLYDWLCHCLALFWKTIFLLVPPGSLWRAWPQFVCSLIGIAVVTVVINDAASLLGCSLGMADDITALTLVAMGTSLPDTMASRTAAMHDETADNSIGNITGSNAVNVFLGMGMSWTIGAVYWTGRPITDEWRHRRTKDGTYSELYLGRYPEGGFMMPAGPLEFSVLSFSIGAVLCVSLLFFRRAKYGGELGGPVCAQRRDSALLLLLWIGFVTANIMYDYFVSSSS
eukprot:TRINITY_DN24510_c0_g1_i1.p1 TRINITY_DN24510_c0_g1~~TRINITY_DN24510_c0_g1_i1.p1  ORF type:complete len:924 (-),score=152.53 TRINITY_DN24510_c0_g1_i1:48-2771(-)